jgi:hypothetical protein
VLKLFRIWSAYIQIGENWHVLKYNVKNSVKSKGRWARSKIGFPFMGEMSEDTEQHSLLFIIECIFLVDIYREYE